VEKSFAPGDEICIGFIGSDQPKIKVGVCICFASGVQTVKGSGYDAIIFLAGSPKTVDDGLVQVRQLVFQRFNKSISLLS